MSRYIHTGIIVTAIGVAASAVAPGGGVNGGTVVASAGIVIVAFAIVFTWAGGRERRADSSAERAARSVERVVSRANRKVDRLTARALRRAEIRAAIAASVHGVDERTGVIADAGDELRVVFVDSADDADVDTGAPDEADAAADDADAAAPTDRRADA